MLQRPEKMNSQVIRLEKDQQIELTKETSLKKGLFGLGWKPTPGAGRVDLDAWCLAIGADDKLVRTVYFHDKVAFGGAISLSGDDTSGADQGEGANAPDEIVTIDLPAIPQEIEYLLLVVNSFTHQSFGKVNDVFCDIRDAHTNEHLVQYDLDADYGKYQSVTVAKIARSKNDPGEWTFKAAGIGTEAGIEAILAMYR